MREASNIIVSSICFGFLNLPCKPLKNNTDNRRHNGDCIVPARTVCTKLMHLQLVERVAAMSRRTKIT